jgi:hypothetical protein
MEDYAICLDDTNLEPRSLHRSEIPKEAQAGDTLFYQDNRWQIDTQETAARAQRVKDMFEHLKKRSANQ